MRYFLSGMVALFLLTACASTEIPDATPQQAVFALKSDYVAILALAVDYENLPRCPETETVVCSDPEVVDIIRTADRQAQLALDGAEDVVRSPAASEDTIELAIEAAKKSLDVARQILKEHVL